MARKVYCSPMCRLRFSGMRAKVGAQRLRRVVHEWDAEKGMLVGREMEVSWLEFHKALDLCPACGRDLVAATKGIPVLTLLQKDEQVQEKLDNVIQFGRRKSASKRE